MHQVTILSCNSYRIGKRKVVDFSSNAKLLMGARKNPLGVYVYQFTCLFYWYAISLWHHPIPANLF